MPVQEPKKSKWLQEVEDDAIRIQTRRFREQEEERLYQASKNAKEQESTADKPEVTTAPEVPAKKGK